jgi:hypothetical protein
VGECGDRGADDLQREMFSKLLGRTWNEGVQAAVDVALLSPHLERFADHAPAVDCPSLRTVGRKKVCILVTLRTALRSATGRPRTLL